MSWRTRNNPWTSKSQKIYCGPSVWNDRDRHYEMSAVQRGHNAHCWDNSTDQSKAHDRWCFWLLRGWHVVIRIKNAHDQKQYHTTCVPFIEGRSLSRWSCLPAKSDSDHSVVISGVLTRMKNGNENPLYCPLLSSITIDRPTIRSTRFFKSPEKESLTFPFHPASSNTVLLIIPLFVRLRCSLSLVNHVNVA